MVETTGTFRTKDGIELFTRTWLAELPRYELLLVHGLGEHSGRWTKPMSYLVARGANVYIYDLRGHGQSEGRRVDIESFELFYSDIAEMATATANKSGMPWVLYGHSLGGLQAAGYLLSGTNPQPNVAILSAPAMDAVVPKVKRVAAAVFSRIAPTLAVNNSIRGEQLSKDPQVGEAYFADPLVQVKATARIAQAIFDEQAELAPQLGDIATPTLVIHGAEDPLVPPSASAPLAQSEGVERRLYPTLRHEIHNEREGADVMGDVGDWIESKVL